ncbi:glycoside hydrolase superfamily [Phialemonium atrogriseum]|uniref:chitinase n=1 Tax=Phialemonium atrogriseum TaxID=1093897 RepID=A0AAJ0FHW3_9PEZI|nr:glycoside hydrolase superfamily [Phialemonium atrogriseum]KAK1763783.1 glycoside hydrolase superfamily [Phialemonium atrogriseum]
MDIVKNGGKPSKWQGVGYFEGWNGNRPCLHMDVVDAPSDQYSIIHFSFAVIAPGTWDVVIPPDSQHQFDLFVTREVGGMKKGTATFLPVRWLSSSRNTISTAWTSTGNIPELQTSPNIPLGGANEGTNYLALLKAIKSQIPSGKTISIAAPASYWYLKAFPIKDISAVVDYIDYDNPWASPGCPEGNCLRSHINMTETKLALPMITKAGVPNNKIMVGLSSYGRFFKMVDACHGPNCHFVGPLSAAKKGEYTDTAGYIANAEIFSIAESDRITWSETHLANLDTSMTDFIVYDGVKWVAFMTHLNKWFRVGMYQDWNFGGFADWAVDLQAWRESTIVDSDPDAAENVESWCAETFDSLEAVDEAKDRHSAQCRNVYALRVLSEMQKSALDSYRNLVAGGYDHEYNLYKDLVKQMAPTALVTFLKKRGNEFFDCNIEEQVLCCDWCEQRYSKERCRYCDNTCKGYQETIKLIHERCPPDVSQRGVLVLYNEEATSNYRVHWVLKAGKRDAFLAAALGLPDDWLGMSKDKQLPVPCAGVWNCECPGFNPDPETCEHTGYWYVARTDDDGVSNPKAFIDEALSKLTEIGTRMDDLADEMQSFFYIEDASPGDVIEAAALPILMLDEAVNSMKQVAKIGEEIDEEQQKNFLIMLLTSLLMLVPFVGQTVGTIARLGTIGRAIAMLGEVGHGAFDIYAVVDNPDSVPLAIFGLVLGAGALRDINKVGQAAKAARGMNPEDLAKLGGRVSGRMKTIKSIAGDTCSR